MQTETSYYDLFIQLRKPDRRRLCRLIGFTLIIHLLFIGATMAMLATNASITTSKLLFDGAIVTPLNSDCVALDPNPCYGIYSCIEMVCEANRVSPKYTALSLFGPLDDCEATTSFSRVWDVYYYRVAIILAIMSLATFFLTILTFPLYIKISKWIFLGLLATMKILLLIGFILGIFLGAHEIENITNEYRPASISVPNNWAHTFMIIVMFWEMVSTWLEIRQELN